MQPELSRLRAGFAASVFAWLLPSLVHKHPYKVSYIDSELLPTGEPIESHQFVHCASCSLVRGRPWTPSTRQNGAVAARTRGQRRIEALVFEHRCELEDDGLDPDEIDRRCVEFRSQLNTTAAAPPAVVDEVSQPLPRLLEQLLSPDDRAPSSRPRSSVDGATRV